jgi:hypothetical protein
MKRVFVALLLFSALAFPTALRADFLASNQWYEFSFTAAGVPALGCYPADQSAQALNCIPSKNSQFAPTPPWNFVVDIVGALIVTDAFLYGDSFDVFDNGAFLFATPAVPFTGAGCGSDPSVCSLDPNSSSLGFGLGPGLQSITIVPNAIGDAGAAYFELIQPTPEPNQLLPAALAAAFALWRRAHTRSSR